MRNRLNSGRLAIAPRLWRPGNGLDGPGADDACGDRKLTKKLEKPMDAVQKAREAKDWAGMLAKAKEVDAVAVEKTEYDRFWIHELQGVANANLKQFPDALRELECGLQLSLHARSRQSRSASSC